MQYAGFSTLVKSERTGEVFQFSDNGRLHVIQYMKGTSFDIHRNQEDVLTGFTTTTGAEYTVECDKKGHITKIISPDECTSIYTYDGENKLISYTDSQSGVTKYKYDKLGRMIRRYDVAGTLQTKNTYDAEKCSAVSG